jgi:hypothetical protein
MNPSSSVAGSDRHFLGCHVRPDIGEERGREIALTGIGQHAENGRALLRAGRDLHRRRERAAGGDSDEDPFLRRQLPAPLHRLGGGHGDHPVHLLRLDRVARELGEEVGTPALDRMRLPGGVPRRGRAVGVPLLGSSARDDRRVRRLGQHDPGLRTLLRQHPGDALERPAGAEPRHPIVQPSAGEVVHNLPGGGAGVEVGIGLVLELPGQEPAVGLGQLDRLVDHPGPAGRRGGQDHLGAEEAHQLPPFHAERLRHGDDQRVPLLGTHHGEADAGVAAGGLDHGLPRLEGPAPLGVFDDAEGESVLDRAQGVERFDLDVQVDAGRRELADLDHRGVADGFQNVGEFGHVWHRERGILHIALFRLRKGHPGFPACRNPPGAAPLDGRSTRIHPPTRVHSCLASRSCAPGAPPGPPSRS